MGMLERRVRTEAIDCPVEYALAWMDSCGKSFRENSPNRTHETSQTSVTRDPWKADGMASLPSNGEVT